MPPLPTTESRCGRAERRFRRRTLFRGLMMRAMSEGFSHARNKALHFSNTSCVVKRHAHTVKNKAHRHSAFAECAAMPPLVIPVHDARPNRHSQIREQAYTGSVLRRPRPATREFLSSITDSNVMTSIISIGALPTLEAPVYRPSFTFISPSCTTMATMRGLAAASPSISRGYISFAKQANADFAAHCHFTFTFH